jgi:hypothetical protein
MNMSDLLERKYDTTGIKIYNKGSLSTSTRLSPALIMTGAELVENLIAVNAAIAELRECAANIESVLKGEKP